MPGNKPTVTAVTEDDLLEPTENLSIAPFKSLLAQYSFRDRPERGSAATPTLSTPSGSTSPRKRVKADDERDSETSASPTKRSKTAGKRSESPKKKALPYAPPDTYAHLHVLQDCVKPNLDILFCGINPGIKSATTGHHFAHPTNQFYRALHESGLTRDLLLPSQDWTMPDRYNYGLTNIVGRPSTSSTELTRAEKIASVPALLKKVSSLRPRIMCFIGREVAEAVEAAIRQHHGSKRKTASPVKSADTSKADLKVKRMSSSLDVTHPDYVSPLATTAPGFRMMTYKMVHPPGLSQGADQPTCIISETLFFTAPSTSGLVTAYRLQDRVQLFRLLLEEKNALIAGTRDTKDFQVIPPDLYRLPVGS